MSKGFTFIELLIVLAILTFLFSLIFPFSHSLYTYYTELREIEKLVLTLGNLRRDSFLYNRENTIFEKNGTLYINDISMSFNKFKFKIKKPISFLKNGTSTGGIIYIFTEKNTYKININTPFGEIWYEKS